MSSKTKTIERNGGNKSDSTKSVWTRAFSSTSEWPDKVGYVVYQRIVN